MTGLEELIERLRAAADEAQDDHEDDVARIADMDGPIAAQVCTDEPVEVVLSLTTVRRCIDALSASAASPAERSDKPRETDKTDPSAAWRGIEGTSRTNSGGTALVPGPKSDSQEGH